MVKIHQLVKFQANPSMHSPANARKPLRTDGRLRRIWSQLPWTDGHAVKRLRLVGWTNGPMYRSKEGISDFGRTDGRTDGQPENMPPAPKGGGIKKSCYFYSCYLKMNDQIRSQFCTCHSSWAAVTCAKLRPGGVIRIVTKTKRIITRFQSWKCKPFLRWVLCIMIYIKARILETIYSLGALYPLQSYI